MPKTKPISKLLKKMPDTPERRLRSEQRRRAIEIGITLGKLCDQPRTTQARATSLDYEEDVYLSTLRESIELLGGHLEINAVFPDRTVTLVPAADESEG